MTELSLWDLYISSSYTKEQHRKLKNLKKAQKNAQCNEFEELWRSKWQELLMKYTKKN